MLVTTFNTCAKGRLALDITSKALTPSTMPRISSPQLFPRPSLNRFGRTLIARNLAVAALFVLAAPDGLAQSDGRWWLGFGAGIGHVGEGNQTDQDEVGSDGAGALYGSYQTGANLFSVRSAGAFELFGDGVLDLGVLYGRATIGEGGHVSFGIGLAVVTGYYQDDGLDFCGLFGDPSDCPDTSTEGFLTAGIPLEVQLALRGRYVGIGIYGFANLNRESSFFGATISLHAGRLY